MTSQHLQTLKYGVQTSPMELALQEAIKQGVILTTATDASGNTVLVDGDGKQIKSLYDPNTPVLIIGGDHPYRQWYGTNGDDGMAAWYNANGITPYIAVNTDSPAPGGDDQMSWEQLRELISAGRVECVGHGHRHYQDNTAPTAGVVVTYTGAAATATFQITGGNAVGVTAGGVSDFSISLSGAPTDTLAELAVAISANANWSCVLSSELAGTEKSSNCQSGAARSAKGVSLDWPVAGGLAVSYIGTSFETVGLQIDATYLYVYTDGRRAATIALSGTYSAIITALEAVTGINADLAGAGSLPNYVIGTEVGTNLNKWFGMRWLSATPLALDAGLSSGYLRHRNNQVNIEQAEVNGVTLVDFAQSGGYHYEAGANDALWRMQRGNSVDSSYATPAILVTNFVPHVSLRHAEYGSAGKITAILDALADSKGYLATVLMHKVLPDGASGYSLPTNDLVYYDQTESNFNTFLLAAKAHIAAGRIRQLGLKDIPASQFKPPVNWFFNPRLKNSGESLLATSTYLIPGWSLNCATDFSAVSVADGEITFTTSSASVLTPLYQTFQLPPCTVEVTADVEIDGYTSGSGVTCGVGRYKYRSMLPELESTASHVYEQALQGNGTLRAVFEIPTNKMQKGFVKSINGPFNLSTNTNIWLYINGKTAIDNINCAAGAASSSAVTAKEVAANINAAIVAAGWPPEYHTAAQAIGLQVVITCPYITGTHGSYVEIRAAGASSATAVIFGSALNHYGKSRASSGSWTSGSWLVDFNIEVNVGATVRIKNLQMRVLPTAVR